MAEGGEEEAEGGEEAADGAEEKAEENTVRGRARRRRLRDERRKNVGAPLTVRSLAAKSARKLEQEDEPGAGSQGPKAVAPPVGRCEEETQRAREALAEHSPHIKSMHAIAKASQRSSCMKLFALHSSWWHCIEVIGIA